MKLGERHGPDSPSQPSVSQPCQYLNLRLVVSRTVKQYNSVAQVTQCDTLLEQPQKTNTGAFLFIKWNESNKAVVYMYVSKSEKKPGLDTI